MPLTLLEASKQVDSEVKRSAIIEMFARNSDLLRVLPFMDITGGAYAYTQEGKLPGVAFRGFNESYTESVGVVNPQVEVLRIAGGDLDVDKALVKTHGLEIRDTREAMKVKALALNITGQVINGDSVANPRVFDGLKNRITGNQLIANSASSGGGVLSLANLDQLIDQVDNPTHLLMSKAMRRIISQAARNTGVAGYITWDKNEFGEKVAFYQDVPILVVDYDDTGARILDFNEANSGGGSAVGQSIYCVSMGDGMLSGLQNGVMEVDDLGQLQTSPVYRTRIEWLVGLAAMHGRCAARLSSIKNGAATA
jgi:hypothetical protein